MRQPSRFSYRLAYNPPASPNPSQFHRLPGVALPPVKLARVKLNLNRASKDVQQCGWMRLGRNPVDLIRNFLYPPGAFHLTLPFVKKAIDSFHRLYQSIRIR